MQNAQIQDRGPRDQERYGNARGIRLTMPRLEMTGLAWMLRSGNVY